MTAVIETYFATAERSDKKTVLADRDFVLVAIQDIADEKRRRVLERTFFHDILNVAGGIQGIVELLEMAENAEELREYVPLLSLTTEQLIGEIHAQRDLQAAEEGELERSSDRVGSLQVLLTRVLGNMVKNALEAPGSCGFVRTGCRQDGEHVEFWVWNDAVMTELVQLQIFRCSFSTTGEGRGVGTYSMKLLTERYLGGEIDFVSAAGRGTRFHIRIPLVAPGE